MVAFSSAEGVPLYVKIRENLREAIKRGEYKQGEKLPSEDELAIKYGVSRMTVRQGIMDLIDENRMAVADKRRKSVAPRPSVIQLGFFEDDDAVFAPMGLTLPKVRRPHERRDFEAFIGTMQQSLF